MVITWLGQGRYRTDEVIQGVWVWQAILCPDVYCMEVQVTLISVLQRLLGVYFWSILSGKIAGGV
jgi:hypothetical protein